MFTHIDRPLELDGKRKVGVISNPVVVKIPHVAVERIQISHFFF